MNQQRALDRQRLRRRRSVRKRVRGTPQRPRLTVFRSHKHIYVQIVDDLAGNTLAAVGTLDADVRKEVKSGGNKTAAAVVGQKIAQRAIEAGVKQVAFDRGHCKYHGRVAALAEAAREAGLEF